jgi:ATP-binding cassette subfamily C protein
MKKIKKIFEILDKKYIWYLLFLLLSIILISLIEILGIGAIPILLSLILRESNSSTDNFFNSFISNFEIFRSFNYSELIIFLSLIIIITFILKNIMLGILFFFQGKLIKRIRIFITNKIYNYYINNEPSLILTENSAKLIRTFTTDIGNTSLHLLFILNLIRDTLILISLSILIFISNFKVSFIIFLSLLSVALIIFIFNKKKLFLRGKKIQEISGQIIQKLNETIGLLKEIKIYGLEKYYSEKFMEKIEINEENIFKNYFITFVPRLLLESTAILILVIIILNTVIEGNKVISFLPFLSLVVVSSIRLIPAFNGITTSLNALKVTKASFDLVSNILTKKIFSKEKISKYKKIKFNENLRLENISFKYPNQSGSVIDNLNLQINKGDRIGIVGPSGSGKSTLINIILGLLIPQNGKIIIDDIVQEKYILENSGYIPQEIFLIDDTIKSNIICGDPKNFDKKLLDKCIEVSQLKETINSLPKDMDTIVGERGFNLSVGQKQRIGVARALYKNPKILILDESTSALDTETEKKFIEDVFSIDKNITIVFISHKMTSLNKCNKIFDLKLNKFN